MNDRDFDLGEEVAVKLPHSGAIYKHGKVVAFAGPFACVKSNGCSYDWYHLEMLVGVDKPNLLHPKPWWGLWR